MAAAAWGGGGGRGAALPANVPSFDLFADRKHQTFLLTFDADVIFSRIKVFDRWIFFGMKVAEPAPLTLGNRR